MKEKTKEKTGAVRMPLADVLMLALWQESDKVTGILNDKSLSPSQKSGEIEELAKKVREDATDVGVYDRMVKRTALLQFAKSLTCTRELIQNSLDAYTESGEKGVIRVSVTEDEDYLYLGFEDDGAGMGVTRFSTKFIVPFDSDKIGDLSLYGEHGIGFFSVFRVADKVEVMTRNGSESVLAEFVNEEGSWNVYVDLEAEKPKQGTSIIIRVKKGGDPGWEGVEGFRSDVNAALRTYAGLVSLERAEIVVDGERVNKAAENFELGGSVSVRTDRGEGELKFFFKENGSETALTQGELYSKDIKPTFLPSSLYRLWLDLRGLGYGLWVDLPQSIALNKARTDVRSDYVDVFKEATEAALLNFVITSVLPNPDLADKLDSAIASFVEDSISSKSETVAKSVVGEFPGDERAQEPGEQKAPLGKGDEKEGEESDEAAPEKPSKSYYGRDEFEDRQTMEGKKAWAAEGRDSLHVEDALFNTPFVKAVREGEEKLLSLNQVMSLYGKGKLSLNLLEGKEYTVTSCQKVVSKVLRVVDDEIKAEKAEKEKKTIKIKPAKGPRVTTEETVPPKPEDRSYEEEEKPLIISLEHTSLGTMERIAEKTGKGWEFVGLLRILNYMETLIEDKELDELEVTVMFHKKHSMNPYSEVIAHTDKDTISYNFGCDIVQSLFNNLLEGGADAKTLISLQELLIHEKAHCELKQYGGEESHAPVFYLTKEKVRETYFRHCSERGADVLEEAQKIWDDCMSHQEGEPISFEELGPLIDDAAKEKKQNTA